MSSKSTCNGSCKNCSCSEGRIDPVVYPGGIISYYGRNQVVSIEGNGLPAEDIYLGEDRNSHPFVQIFRIIKRIDPGFRTLGITMYPPNYRKIDEDRIGVTLQLRVNSKDENSASFLNFIRKFVLELQNYLMNRSTISFSESKYFKNLSDLVLAKSN